ncbi:4Fe-4S binding protein [Thiovibrio sp. JS02]
MCEFCTKHGEGKIWFTNAANYARDLMSDLGRRGYIRNFFTSTIEEGLSTIGRLEVLYRKKRQLPRRLVEQIRNKAKEEHFGQVVTIEDIREIIGKAATVVRLPCACRWAALKKENRCCFSVSYTPDAWYEGLDMGYFGLAQDQGLETVSREEAISQMEALEREGAIHTIWTMMTPFIGAICNCQPLECLGLRTLNLQVETMFRGERVAGVDESKCLGCGACQEACPFRAITGREEAGAFKAKVHAEQCFGCGLCRNACPEAALGMISR